MGGTKPCKHAGSGGIQLAFRFTLQKIIRSFGLLQEYDWFVVTRFDHFFLCDHPTDFYKDAAKIWHFEGEGCGGVSDRHFAASKHTIEKALNVTQDLVCHPNEVLQMSTFWVLGFVPVQLWWVNVETLLAKHYERQGLATAFMPRPAFAVKLPQDPTRWSTGLPLQYDEVKPLVVKYEGEYKGALVGCDLRPENVVHEFSPST